MCGIIGEVGDVSASLFVKKGLERMRYRGPDSEGIFDADCVKIGHVRLSIVDLSTNASQPMHSYSGAFSIVFNGEIYNYLELGYKYFGKAFQSDSRLLIELIEKKGLPILNELNGMFSFALYNHYDKKVYLVRDRLGIKPLYYNLFDDGIRFSSELSSFKSLNLGFDPDAIAEYLRIGFVKDPNSLIKGVKSLKPGSYATYTESDGSFDVQEYWTLPRTKKVFRRKELQRRLELSVKARLISDVKVGSFLSGGIDSSLITSIYAKLEGARNIESFTFGMQNEKLVDETPFAFEISKQLGIRNSVIREEFTDAIHNDLLRLLKYWDTPLADTSIIPTFLVSKLASTKVKVVLSGDGADELFYGYERMFKISLIKFVKRNFLIREIVIAIVNVFFSSKKNTTFFKVFLEKNCDNIYESWLSKSLGLFSETECNTIVKGTTRMSSVDAKNKDIRHEEISKYLLSNILIKTDRATMLNSIEGRVPFLDHRVVEYAMSLHPLQGIIYGGLRKAVLKKILFTMLPKRLFSRPKTGFNMDVSPYLAYNNEALIVAATKKMEGLSILNADLIRNVFDDWREAPTKSWALIMLIFWMDE